MVSGEFGQVRWLLEQMLTQDKNALSGCSVPEKASEYLVLQLLCGMWARD